MTQIIDLLLEVRSFRPAGGEKLQGGFREAPGFVPISVGDVCCDQRLIRVVRVRGQRLGAFGQIESAGIVAYRILRRQYVGQPSKSLGIVGCQRQRLRIDIDRFLDAALPFFFAIALGRHLGRRDVVRRRVTNVRLVPALSGERVPYQIDGDPGGELPVELSVAPESLWVRLPVSTRS